MTTPQTAPEPPPVVREYRLKRRVQFAETDMAGLAHFSCYLRYMEEAEHALWREAGLSIAERGAEVSFPRVAVSVEYRAPLHFEDEFEIWIRIERMSRRTIHYGCTITAGTTTIATGTLTAVCVRRQPKMHAAEIPDAIRARIGPVNPAA